MIDSADHSTIDLFPVKRGRGRPATGAAKSSAQRQREYRQRVKKTGVSLTSVKPLNVDDSYIDNLQDEIKMCRMENYELLKLLNRYLAECGDYASCIPSEKWVNDVRDALNIHPETEELKKVCAAFR